MKSLFLLFCIFATLASTSTICSAAALTPIRVRMIEGTLSYRTPDTEEWNSAPINTALDEGDSLWCPQGSRAELQLPDGTLVRLDGGALIDVLAIESGYTHLHLASGRIYLRTLQTFKDGSLQIDADDTTVLPATRTRLRVDMLPNNQEDVSIFKGSAYVEGNGSRTRVRAGEQLMLEEGHNELLALNPPDEWENWNSERDRLLSKGNSSDAYLPEELKGYSDEMSANGSWAQTPEYGMVWRPTVVVASDWAPYRTGRWVWRNGVSIWISDENWGWVPYHYGRWIFTPSFGWCWVPPQRGDVYWGPGYVGWYQTGDVIGWTPLAPGETYYGYGNYGRFSVNITNVTVNKTVIVYRNAQHRGGVTSISHNDFSSGKTVPRNQGRNFFENSKAVSIGNPRIKPAGATAGRATYRPAQPQKENRLPAGRPVSPRDMKDLRQRFPRVNPTATGTPRIMTEPGAPPPFTPQRPQMEHERQQVTPPPARSIPVETPSAVPQHRDIPQNEVSTPAPAGSQHKEREKQEPDQLKKKKVWKITTPEPQTHEKEHH